MTNKEKAMQLLLELSPRERKEVMDFFLNKTRKQPAKKRLKKNDPMLSVDYHYEIIKKRLKTILS